MLSSQSLTDGEPLTRHINENPCDQSNSDTIIQCDQSGKSSLIQGKNTCENSNDVEQPYQCNRSDQSVSAGNQLLKPIQVDKTYETDNQRQCQVCGMAFSTLDEYAVHTFQCTK